MSDPISAAEYNERFQANVRVEGFGLEVTMHMPCPFCAAPDFMVYKVLSTEEAMKSGGSCKQCGRSAAALFDRTPDRIRFSIVQTGGPDQPAWMEPKMPRK
jgi:hypothetical protein